MTYCRVIIETTTRGTVYQKDFEALNIFGPLVQMVAGTLVNQETVQEGEHYRALIHPCYEAALSPGPRITIDAAKASESYPAWLNLLTPNNGAHAGDPLTYFTLELRFEESGVIYRYDLETLNLSYFWSNLQTALVKMRVLQDGDLYYPRLYVRSDDENADFTREISTPLPQDLDDAPLLVEVIGTELTGPEFPTRSREAFNVVGVHEVALVTANGATSTLSESQDDVQVLIAQATFDALQRIARTDVQVEQGGMLVGDVYRSAKNPAQFLVVITDYIVAEGTSASLVELRYTFESWLQSAAELKTRCAGKRIVGWYHTHLVQMPVRTGDAAHVTGTDLFFSEDDRFMQRQFFSDKWYVAMVLGQQGHAVFFRWFGDQIGANRRFYLITPEAPSVQTGET